MTAEEMIELLEERPFKPLRLHLADGRTREILHRQLAVVAQDFVAIGFPADGRSKVARRVTRCPLPDIVKVEPFIP